MSYKFFYTFSILPEKEKDFETYMDDYGRPLMTEQFIDWEFFKIKDDFTDGKAPQYLGSYTVNNLTEFLSKEPTAEMLKAMEHIEKLCSNRKEWIMKLTETNIKRS